VEVRPLSALASIVLALGTTEALHRGAAWNRTLSGLIGILVATAVVVLIDRHAPPGSAVTVSSRTGGG
jgi:hypothetical protein